MDYVDRLRKAGKEETEAYLQYSRLADDAEEAGDYSSAQQIRIMADQELEHSRMITRMLASFFSPERKRAKEVLGRISEPMGGGFKWAIKSWKTGEEHWGTSIHPSAEEARKSGEQYVETDLVGQPVEDRGFLISILDKDGYMVAKGKFYVPSWRGPSQVGRPFPETYGDWVNLAEDIKAKLPDDPATRACVNFQLQHIAEREDEDEAKRWLVNKAGKLGIG